MVIWALRRNVGILHRRRRIPRLGMKSANLIEMMIAALCWVRWSPVLLSDSDERRLAETVRSVGVGAFVARFLGLSSRNLPPGGFDAAAFWQVHAPGLVYLALISFGFLYFDVNAPAPQRGGGGFVLFWVVVGWLGAIVFYSSMLIATCRYMHWLAGIGQRHRALATTPNTRVERVTSHLSVSKPLGRPSEMIPSAPPAKRKPMLAWISSVPLMFLVFVGSREWGRQMAFHKRNSATTVPQTTQLQQVSNSTFENGRYTNAFFAFSVTIPPNWQIGVDSHATERKAMTAALATQQTPEMRREMAAAKTKTPTLLAVYPTQELIDEASPSFSVLAEDVSTLPRMSAEEYLELSRRSFSQIEGFTKQFGVPYQIPCQGGNLVACDITVNGESIAGFMTFGVIIRKQHALTFVVCAGSPANHNVVKSFLNERLKFE